MAKLHTRVSRFIEAGSDSRQQRLMLTAWLMQRPKHRWEALSYVLAELDDATPAIKELFVASVVATYLEAMP